MLPQAAAARHASTHRIRGIHFRLVFIRGSMTLWRDSRVATNRVTRKVTRSQQAVTSHPLRVMCACHLAALLGGLFMTSAIRRVVAASVMLTALGISGTAAADEESGWYLVASYGRAPKFFPRSDLDAALLDVF